MNHDDESLWPAALGAGIALAVVVFLWPRKASAVTRPTYQRGMTGREFLATLQGLDLRQREAAIVEAATAGAVPEVFDRYVPVPVQARGRTGIFWAAPWHLAIGTNADAFHAPLSAPSAQRVADAWGQSLPTRAMSAAIRASSDFTRLPFHAVPPEAGHRSLETYASSSAATERDRQGRSGPFYGYAKDYILTPRRRGHEERIAIYGAWDRNGRVIQDGNGLPHDTGHVDYSQKPRFVANVVQVDGVEMSLADALASPDTAFLFSDEGAIPVELQRYPA